MRVSIRSPAGTQEALRARWEEMARVALRLPIEVRVDFGVAQRELADAVAKARVLFEDRGPRAIIHISKAFMEQRAIHQNLTLLHELIHLALLAGPCKSRQLRSDEIEDQFRYFRGRSRDERDFERQQVSFARWLYFFVDEVMAEKHLAQNYPQLAASRLEQYQAMQQASWDGQVHEQSRGEFRHAYLLLLWLRNRLGVLLAASGTLEAEQFEERAGAYQGLLGAEVDNRVLEPLLSAGERVLAATGDGAGCDEQAANSLFAWALTITQAATA